jgi:N-acetylmuramoyl-L-alanine amidase
MFSQAAMKLLERFNLRQSRIFHREPYASTVLDLSERSRVHFKGEGASHLTPLGRNSRTRQLLAWCCATALAACISASGAALKRIDLGPGTYVSLNDWARQKGFTVDWDRENKLAQVNSKWTKLTFNVTSKKASINGLSVWLCSAVLEHRDALYISERDIYKTIHPILYPEKMAKGKRVKTVAIAAGHGGKDPGNMVNREQEKKYTLLLAKALKEELIAHGFKVVMTRETDTFIDLEPQAQIARRAKADLFVTVHYNAVADVSPKGVETFALTPAGAISTNGGSPNQRSDGNKNDTFNMLLAQQVHKSILRRTDFDDRGIRRASFMVLRHLNMPGILVEGGFMSNPSDAKKIYSTEHRKIVARAIAEGIVNYRSLVERK